MPARDIYGETQYSRCGPEFRAKHVRETRTDFLWFRLTVENDEQSVSPYLESSRAEDAMDANARGVVLREQLTESLVKSVRKKLRHCAVRRVQ